MGTLAIIIVSSSFATAFANNGLSPVEDSTGRYSFADPRGTGSGEGSHSEHKDHPYYSTKYVNKESSGVASFSVEANLLNGCNCVVFRLDDVQDWWLSDVQVAVMDQFVQKNQYLSAGPIVGLFGADANVVDKTIAGYNSGLFEIFVHGWDHVDYTTLNLATQTSTLQDSQNKLQLLFGSPSTVFVPPFNTFDANTLTALETTGLNIISSAEWWDTYPYFVADGTSDIVDSQGIYHLPETIGFTDWVDGSPVRVPNSQILSFIDSSVTSKGYAVVTLHSQEFAQKQGGVEINAADQALLDDLNFVIDEVLAKNYQIQTFNQVVEFNQSAPSDTQAPVITPLGTSTSIPFGSTYTELGATVTDDDPSYSGTVTVGGDTVNTSVAGNYIITYNAPADAAGNVPVQQSITITVEEEVVTDTQAPVITPLG
ncbi:MAG: immunoglobulin-like domain-containing protein, partial [Nitrosopumilaceae archaeon]